MSNRRAFLKQAALGTAATSFAPLISHAKGNEIIDEQPGKELKLGIAGYTFSQSTIPQAIAMMQRVNIKTFSLKDIQLPLNSTKDKIDEVVNTFKQAGIAIYGVGVIYMKKKEDADQAFEYAKMVGVDLIIGSPVYDLLPYVEEKVKQYNIRVAIHNHGPEDPVYPTPGDVYEHVKNLDGRMGLCLDIGHTQRDKIDPGTAYLQYHDRIMDMHVKDVSAAEKDGKSLELGRGVIDVPGLVKALYKKGYNGYCSFEHEKDAKDPLPGLAESVGYFKGVCDAVKKK
ncbi:MAG TPA: sugar phosphate isomerase/epimerase family protein [Chitinophagaceae bacterium]|nr:sugar phosphate isomerase/epimerase family protein [Chitinophagaceae bacterium]